MKWASRVQICVRTVGLGNDTAANQPLQGRESTRLGFSHFVILSNRTTGPKHTATASGRATRNPHKNHTCEPSFQIIRCLFMSFQLPAFMVINIGLPTFPRPSPLLSFFFSLSPFLLFRSFLSFPFFFSLSFPRPRTSPRYLLHPLSPNQMPS